MYPQLFEVIINSGQVVTVSAYRFFGLVALVYVAVAAYLCLKRFNLSVVKSLLCIIILSVSFLIGARLLYTLLYLPQATAQPAGIFQLHLGNFALFGGFALALPAWWLLNLAFNLPFFKITDQLAPHTGVAAALLRVGCFLAGCCYGKLTNMPWGVSFPVFSPAHRAQLYSGGISTLLPPQAIHPTQLYEMFVALLASFLAWYALRKKMPDGLAAAVFGFSFALGRLIVFFFRAFPVAESYSNILRGPVVYGLAMMIFALWIIKVYGFSLSGFKGRVLKCKTLNFKA